MNICIFLWLTNSRICFLSRCSMAFCNNKKHQPKSSSISLTLLELHHHWGKNWRLSGVIIIYFHIEKKMSNDVFNIFRLWFLRSMQWTRTCRQTSTDSIFNRIIINSNKMSFNERRHYGLWTHHHTFFFIRQIWTTPEKKTLIVSSCQADKRIPLAIAQGSW